VAKYHQPAKLRSPFSNRNGRTGGASSKRTLQQDDSGPRCHAPPAAWNSRMNRASAASAAATATPATQPPSRPKNHEWANSNDKTNERAALTGNGPTYVSRDSSWSEWGRRARVVCWAGSWVRS
jgi:hypothetical protein